MLTNIFIFASLLIVFFLFLELYYLSKKKVNKALNFSLIILSLSGLGISWFILFYGDISFKDLFTASASGLLLCSQITVIFWIGLLLSTSTYLVTRKAATVKLMLVWIFSRSLIVVAIILISLTAIITLEIRLRGYLEEDEATEVVVEEYIPTVEMDFGLFIPEGGSLCSTLGVTKEEALKIAKINNLPYHYQGKKLIVIVQPEDEFIRVGRVWYMSDKD